MRNVLREVGFSRVAVQSIVCCTDIFLSCLPEWHSLIARRIKTHHCACAPRMRVPRFNAARRLGNFGLTEKSVQVGTPIELTIYFCSIFSVSAQVQQDVNKSRTIIYLTQPRPFASLFM